MEASEREEWGIPGATEVEQRGLQEMPHLSPRVLHSDPGAFRSRCFPKLSYFIICCSSILQAGKLRSTPMKEPAQTCTTPLWQRSLPSDTMALVQLHCAGSLQCPLSSLVSPPQKTSVSWAYRKMEPWLALIHCKEAETVGVSHNLVFSHVRWG